MPKTRELRDAYRFPFFTPSTHVRGTFRDAHGMVIDLSRRQKKRCADHAVLSVLAGMMPENVTSVISRAARNVSICTSPFDVSSVPSAKP